MSRFRPNITAKQGLFPAQSKPTTYPHAEKNQNQRELLLSSKPFHSVASKRTVCVNLFQPWADAVVQGLLPLLARRFPIKLRGKVGVAATNGFDSIILNQLTVNDMELAAETLAFGCVIGHVFVDDCIEVSRAKCWEKVAEIAGSRVARFYPVHLMPQTEKAFLWTLSNPARYARPIRVISPGITWSSASLPNERRLAAETDRQFWKEYDVTPFLRENLEMKRHLWVMAPATARRRKTF